MRRKTTLETQHSLGLENLVLRGTKLANTDFLFGCVVYTGKETKITITNDKSRLSKDEIERMVEDAEKFKKDDEQEAERLKGKLSLEAYCLDLKSAMENEKLDQEKIKQEKKKIVDTCNKAVKWIGKNKLANKDEYEDKEKAVKAVCDPIITALFKDAGLDDNGGLKQKIIFNKITFLDIPGHHSHSHDHHHGHGHGHGGHGGSVGGHGHHGKAKGHGHGKIENVLTYISYLNFRSW